MPDRLANFFNNKKGFNWNWGSAWGELIPSEHMGQHGYPLSYGVVSVDRVHVLLPYLPTRCHTPYATVRSFLIKTLIPNSEIHSTGRVRVLVQLTCLL